MGGPAITDIACYAVPFPTPEQKRHWLRMKIRRLRSHIETLKADLARLEAELAEMEAGDG
jgi:hypothetical protein